MKKTLMLILISICTYACDSRVGANADDDITAKVDTGVDCDTLAEWSDPIAGMRVNQHHIFCGEPARRDRAKGFHSMPGGIAPNNHEDSQAGDPANAAGIYSLRNIELLFNGRQYEKTFSTMYPKRCSLDQVNHSIVYANQNARGSCANPSWAQCGNSAPRNNNSGQYCVGDNGRPFTIATAVLQREPSKINTGFPIRE